MTTYFLELGWKSTVVLVMAAIVAYLLRKQSAGARHVVWKLACLSLLLLPMGQALMPGWNVMPDAWSISALPLKTYRHFEAAPRNTGEPMARPDVTPREMPAGGAPAMPFGDPISTPMGHRATASKSVVVEAQPKFVEVAQQMPVARPSRSMMQIVLSWGAMIWLTVAGGLQCRLMVSALRLWWVSSGLKEVRDEGLIALLESLKQTLSLRRSVRMRISNAETMPMVWGLWKPEIIVPETIASWPVEQQTSVLLHELAHVKRLDPFWQVVVELTKVIYWPQPLLWLAMRQIERLREQACDDLVLNSGVAAADYARSLLDVVSHGRLRRIWPAVGVAIVSTPSIEMRLKTILDRTVNRLAVSRTMALIVLIAAISTSVTLTCFRLTVPSIVETLSEVDAPKKVAVQELSQQDEKPVEAKPVEATPQQKERRQIVLEVLDEDGKPVQGAKIDIVGLRTLVNHASHYGWVEKLHGSKPKEVTNEKGEITIDYPEFVLEQMRTSVLSILIEHPDFAAKNHELYVLIQNRSDRPVYQARQKVRLQRGVVYQISFADVYAPARPMSTHVMFSDLWRGDQKFHFRPPNSLISSRRDDQPRIAQVVRRTESGQLLFSNVISDSDWIKEGELRVARDVLLSPGRLLSGVIDDAVPRPVKNGYVLAQCVYLDSNDAKNQMRLTFADATEIQPDGSFKFDSLPRGVPVQLVALCDGWWSSQPMLNELRADPEFEPYVRQLQGVGISGLWPQLVSARQSGGVFIPMDKTRTVTLKCLDPEGKPLAGANVSIWPNLSTYHHGSSLLGRAWSAAKDWIGVEASEIQANQLELYHAAAKHWSRTTGEDGLASFEGLPNLTFVNGGLEHPQFQMAIPVGSVQRFAMIPVHDGQEPFVIRTERIGENPMGELAPAIEEEHKEPSGTFSLPSTTTPKFRELSGVVVDENGTPIEGALVDAKHWVPGNETKTDSEGRFTLKFDEDTESRVEIRVTKEGYSPFYDHRQPLGSPRLKVVLGQKTYFEGRVTGPDGQGVANVEVRGEQSSKQDGGYFISAIPWTTKTDAEGRYRLYAFPDTYQFLVRVPGVGTSRMTGIAISKNEAKQVNIQLQKGVRFEAMVVDSETNQPVSDVVLWTWRHKGVEARSDSNGKIAIDDMLPGEFEFDVGEGTFEMINSYKTYQPKTIGRWWSSDAVHETQRKHIEPERFQRNLDSLSFDLKDGMKPVTIVVEKGVTFSGRVLDPDGKPVEGATVAPAQTGSGNSLTGDTRYSVSTDADGKYRVTMPAGNHFQYNLIAHDGDYREWRQWGNGIREPIHTKSGEVIENYDLVLTRPATVRGRIVGQYVEGSEVRAHAKDMRENRYYDPTTKVKADGTFELKFIRPGEHYIQVEPFAFPSDEVQNPSTTIATLKSGEVLEGVELRIGR